MPGLRKADDGEGGYMVTSSKGDHEYRVSIEHNSCSCPDHIIRHRQCKHMVLVKESLGLENLHHSLTDNEKKWIEAQGDDFTMDDADMVLGDKRVKELLFIGEIFESRFGFYKQLK